MIRRIFGSGWLAVRLAARTFETDNRVKKISRIDEKKDHLKEPDIICLKKGKVHVVC